MNSGAQTHYYCAALLEVTPALWGRIDRANELIAGNGIDLRSVDLRVSLRVLAGFDYHKDLNANGDQVDDARQRLDGVGDEPSWITPADFEMLCALEAQDSDDEVLRIHVGRGQGPTIHLYEHDAYEYFESLEIPQLDLGVV
jgi:hypothetical protein